jgi:hypothetical protein
VFLVHRRLGVAAEAAELPVTGRTGVAGGALPPAALGVLAGVDREPARIVVEDRPAPLDWCVANLAILGIRDSLVIGLAGAGKPAQVTRHALGRLAPIDAVGMAPRAGRGDMGSGQGELRRGVIEDRTRPL